MGKGIFGIVLAIFFVIIGIYLVTNESLNNPDGTLSWQNYAGITCIVFFVAVALIGISKFFTARKAG